MNSGADSQRSCMPSTYVIGMCDRKSSARHVHHSGDRGIDRHSDRQITRASFASPGRSTICSRPRLSRPVAIRSTLSSAQPDRCTRAVCPSIAMDCGARSRKTSEIPVPASRCARCCPEAVSSAYRSRNSCASVGCDRLRADAIVSSLEPQELHAASSAVSARTAPRSGFDWNARACVLSMIVSGDVDVDDAIAVCDQNAPERPPGRSIGIGGEVEDIDPIGRRQALFD